MRRLASIAFALTVASVASVASAQDALAPPAPSSAVAPRGEYVAPLQQQTQLTYVPQSVALSGPRVISDYNDGDPIPAGYQRSARSRTGLIAGGAVTFGTLYVISALVGGASVDNNKGCMPSRYSSCMSAGWLYAPVIGPFVEMGRTGRGSAVSQTVLAIDGLGQAAGAAMLIGGLTVPKIVLVRNDIATGKPVEKLTVAPYFAGTSGGVVGRF